MGDAAIWEATGEGKRRQVRRMFGEIAPAYDRLNAFMSLGLHHRWRTLATRELNLRPGEAALDVCTGTGDFLAPLRRAVGSTGLVVGVDFCPPMLERAAPKGDADGLAAGDATRLPVRSEAFDAVTVGWGIRNVPDPDAAHREAFRVLKPGGRFASVDMARPARPFVRAVSRFLSHTALPMLGRLWGRAEAYRYLPESTDRHLSREALAESMRRAGFTDVRWKDLMFGNITIHFATRPEAI